MIPTKTAGLNSSSQVQWFNSCYSFSSRSENWSYKVRLIGQGQQHTKPPSKHWSVPSGWCQEDRRMGIRKGEGEERGHQAWEPWGKQNKWLAEREIPRSLLATCPYLAELCSPKPGCFLAKFNALGDYTELYTCVVPNVNETLVRQ